MGCDAYIIDKGEPVILIVTCYGCGEEIDVTDTEDIAAHDKCCASDEGIPVSTTLTNTSDR